MSAVDNCQAAFRAHFGGDPEAIAFASGRVNLIGEHVDYNDGLVLPMPVAQGTAVAWRRVDSANVEVIAADLGKHDCFPIAAPTSPECLDWRAYCRGMVAYAPVRPIQGLQLAITGDLARGAGLSSSASLCVALGRALADAAGTAVDPIPLALAAQRTEHEFAGVACGVMDQMAIAAGRAGEAMLLDCRDLSFRRVAVPEDWVVLVVHSGITRGLVDGEYNARRLQCGEAAAALGVASLRDSSIAELDRARLPAVIDRRARHVIDEIARVRDAVDAISAHDICGFAAVLREGHASLRDLFEVSVPAIDRLVDDLQAVLGDRGGARMTGAGFGGAVVVVADRDAARRVVDMAGARATRVYGKGSA